jgi:predicted phosphohydrolase
MKLQYCSDLHLEFPDNKKFILENPIVPVGDVLILAGDIVPFALMDFHQDFFDYVSKNFKMTLWIPGNHEYYYYERTDTYGIIDMKIRDNVFLVNNIVKEIDDVRIICTTLWSAIPSDKADLIQKAMSDFKVIKPNKSEFLVEDYNYLHKESISFLNEVLKESTDKTNIVISHHVPTFLNYPLKYIDSKINVAFASEQSEMIKSHKIDHWIFGHHHSNMPDFSIGKTIMHTNQLGYVKYGENDGYVNAKCIVV